MEKKIFNIGAPNKTMSMFISIRNFFCMKTQKYILANLELFVSMPELNLPQSDKKALPSLCWQIQLNSYVSVEMSVFLVQTV